MFNNDRSEVSVVNSLAVSAGHIHDFQCDKRDKNCNFPGKQDIVLTCKHKYSLIVASLIHQALF